MAVHYPDFMIVHDDEDIMVVDKPAGLLSVPIPGSQAKNLLSLMKTHFGKSGAKIDTVHRIDRYTSGLMVFAKNNRAYTHLFNQFKSHTPVRCYLAVVRGILEHDTGELRNHLRLIKEGFRNIIADPAEDGAAPARLIYKIKERFRDATLVEVYLDTGLKNQIRVQFEAIGHQLVGDQHYAPEEAEEPLINRQALHAWQLSFRHPSTNENVTYTAPLPPDMLRLLDHHRWKLEIRGKL